jgi:hypothetical protein
VRINKELLERKVAAPVQKTEINDHEGSAALPRNTSLSANVGTKLHQQVAVAQSVQFACGLKATEFVLFVGNQTLHYPAQSQSVCRLRNLLKNAIFSDMGLVKSNVSEEGVSSIFKVERIHELGTMLAVTSRLSRSAKKH